MLRRLLFLAFTALLLPTQAPAANCTSNGGLWGSAATWANCGGLVPQNGDTVQINAGTVTLNVANAPATGSLALLTMNGGTLTFGNDANARTLSVSGNVLLTTGTINVAANNTATPHVLNVGGNVTVNGTSTLDLRNASAVRVCTLNLTNTGTATIGGTTTGTTELANVSAAGNLTISKSNAVVTQSGSLDVTGNLSVAAGTYNLAAAAAGLNTSIDGTTSVTGTLGHTTANGTRTFTGTVTVNAGGAWSNTGNVPVSFGTNLVNNNTFTPGTGAQQFTAATATISGSGAITFGGSVTANNLTINKTAGNVQTAALDVNGNLLVSAGRLNLTNTTDISGNTQVDGILAITNAASTKVFNGNFSVTATGQWLNNTVNDDVQIGGDLSNANTFSAGSGTYTFSGAGAWSGAAGLIFDTVIVQAARTNSTNVNITDDLNVQAAGTLTNSASAVLDVGDLSTIAGTLSNSGTATFGDDVTVTGTLRNDAGTMNVNGGGTSLIVTGGTFRVEGGTVSVGTVANDRIQLTDDAGTTFLMNGGTLNVAGRITSDDAAGAGSFTLNGGDIAVGTAGNTGNSQLNAPFFIPSGMSYTFNGGNIVIQSTNTSGAAREYDVTSTTSTVGTSGTVQIGNASTAAGQTFQIESVPAIPNLTINATNAPAASLITAITVNRNVTISGGTLAANSLGISLGGNWTNSGTFTPGTQTVTFNGTIAQAIGGSSTTGFSSVTITNTSAAVTANTSFNTSGTLTMSGAATLLSPVAAAIVGGTGTLTGTGTVQVTRTAATPDFLFQYTITNKTYTNLTVEYVGAAAQTVSTLAYGGLKINNASGVTLAGNPTVGTLLTLTSGAVTTNANVLAVTAACPGSVTRTGGHVAGNLRLRTPAAGSPTCVFDVGDATAYRPVSVAFTTLSAAGDVTAAVSQSATDSPNIGTSTFDPTLTANRYWTITNASTFASAAATFTYSTDVDSGVAEDAFVVGRYSGGWTYLTTVTGSGSAQATGLTSATLAGQFQIGEHGLSIFSHWRMDQNFWAGTSNEVVDSGAGSGGPYHGTAATCAFAGCAVSGTAPPKPNTFNTPAAIAGSPGTCTFGVFNRGNKDFIDVPSGFPKLATSAGGFTIAGWIRTTDSTQSGQRIMIDDQAGANGNWGLSLGDGGAGSLRFFIRQAANFIVDTPVGNLANNTWYYVAASVSLAAGANASRGSLFAFNQAGTLVASATSTFTWTVSGATPGGALSIGGENNAGSETTSAFGFAGNIDEVRVYRAALTSGQINRLRQETRTCPAYAPLDHIRIEHNNSALTCVASTITVKACANTACSVLTPGTVTATLTTTAGAYTTNPVSITGGSTTTNLSVTTAQTVTLGTQGGSISPAPVAATDCNNGTVTNGTTACQLAFANTGFIFSAATGGAAVNIGNQVAATSSATYYLRAVRTSDATKACEAALVGSSAVDFAYECDDPTTCSGSNLMSINGGSSTTIARNDNGAPSSYLPVTMTFDADGNAPFTLNYGDVGQVTLHARKTNVGGATLSGASNSFIVRPAGVLITNILRADNSANPAALDATGAVFMKAGDDFKLTVTVVGSGGVATPNFGRETSPQSVALTAARLAGVGLASDGSVGNGTIAGGSFTSGVANVTNVSWSEVGVMTLTPSFNYLGTGTVSGTTTGRIGRFTPFNFGVAYNAPEFARSCGTFTYFGQSFNYAVGARPVLTVTALSKSGGTTANYRNGTGPAEAWFKVTPTTLTGQAYTVAGGTIDDSGISANPDVVSNNDGTGTVTLTAETGGIRFVRPATATAPMDADVSVAINVIDGDNVVFSGNPARFGQATAGNGIAFVAGGKQMRFGRLRLQNALASSGAQTLRAPAETQYWTGTHFLRNADDSCTSIPAASFTINSSLSGGSTSVTSNPVAFASGLSNVVLSAPGAANKGSVLMTGSIATSHPWLQGAWTGSTFTENPTARASWGVFGSQPRNFIFQRENFQ